MEIVGKLCAEAVVRRDDVIINKPKLEETCYRSFSQCKNDRILFNKKLMGLLLSFKHFPQEQISLRVDDSISLLSNSDFDSGLPNLPMK